MTLHFKYFKFFCGFILCFHSINALADYDHRGKRRLHNYTVGEGSCKLQLIAKGGGDENHSGNINFPTFADEVGRNNQSMNFDFHCIDDTTG